MCLCGIPLYRVINLVESKCCDKSARSNLLSAWIYPAVSQSAQCLMHFCPSVTLQLVVHQICCKGSLILLIRSYFNAVQTTGFTNVYYIIDSYSPIVTADNLEGISMDEVGQLLKDCAWREVW